jgi:hypothetical protein
VLDVEILVPRTVPPDDIDKVDWGTYTTLKVLMEDCGAYPIHLLTAADVQRAYDTRLTEEQCEEVIFKIQGKDTSWDWEETVHYYASSMFPKAGLPGKDPDEEDDA